MKGAEIGGRSGENLVSPKFQVLDSQIMDQLEAVVVA
jgi:hypothetical protein